jgi:hypothetical protein
MTPGRDLDGRRDTDGGGMRRSARDGSRSGSRVAQAAELVCGEGGGLTALGCTERGALRGEVVRGGLGRKEQPVGR